MRHLSFVTYSVLTKRRFFKFFEVYHFCRNQIPQLEKDLKCLAIIEDSGLTLYELSVLLLEIKLHHTHTHLSKWGLSTLSKKQLWSKMLISRNLNLLSFSLSYLRFLSYLSATFLISRIVTLNIHCLWQYRCRACNSIFSRVTLYSICSKYAHKSFW